MIRISIKVIMWLEAKFVIINHLGINPKKGGSPPSLNRMRAIIRKDE